MNKILNIAILLGLCSWINTFAAKPVEVVVDQITYSIAANEATVVSAERNLNSVQIPEYIEYQNISYPVRHIGTKAFYDNLMTSVHIPKSVISSGEMAFCTPRIKNVFIDDLENWCGISFYDSDSNPIWNGANLYLDGQLLKEISIPFGVEKIDNYAFYGYTKLTSVKLSSSVKYIGTDAFFNCTYLTSIDFSENIELIGDGAFYNTGITKIELPNSVTEIKDGAFQSCKKLEKVFLDKSLVKIGSRAFQDNESLTEVYCACMIPPTLETQEGLTFDESYAFVGSYPQGMILHVPKGTKGSYSNSEGWSLFGSIIDDMEVSSGLNIIIGENKDNQVIEYFNFQGVKSREPSTGIYIIRKGNKISKEIIK